MATIPPPKQPSSSRKVKFKLVQPAIKCSGRDDVTCYYRGRIIEDDRFGMSVLIKQHGQEVLIYYSKEVQAVITEGFEDLVLQ